MRGLRRGVPALCPDGAVLLGPVSRSGPPPSEERGDDMKEYLRVPVRKLEDLDVERWQTLAPSETTVGSPLTPARDPANKAASVSVEWAGRCRDCGMVLWSSVAPTSRAVPRLCPDCRVDALRDGKPVGPPVFRPWLVGRRLPEATRQTARQRDETPGQGVHSGVQESTSHEAVGNHADSGQGFVPLGPNGLAAASARLREARRGGRPRRHASVAERKRAYRTRQRELAL
jgi:hypothetical protein